jgi:tight adherence protein B
VTSTEELDRVAGIVHRLAVLMAAGVLPSNAWGYLDAADGSPADRVLRAVQDGIPVEEALLSAAGEAAAGERDAWRSLGTAWAVATASGAPLAPTLLRMAATLRDLAQTSRDIGVALAGPAATRRLVLWLPAVGILFGVGLGFDPLRMLLTTSPGWACATAGLALLLIARAWTARLVRAARPRDAVPGMDLDLLAIAVSGGGSPDRAIEILRERAGIEPSDAGRRMLDLSARAGVPAAELLRAEADQARRQHVATAQIRVARLGVTLLIPLGVCVLPAFLVLGVAPLLFSVLSQTMGGF